MQRSASPRAADPRPARTRAAIYAAVQTVVALPGEDVSVNAIVRAAGISRSAFYAQFSDLDDLAVAMLVDAFRDIGTDDVRARSNPDVDLRRTARAATLRLVRHIHERRAFYRASLDWRLSSRVTEAVVDAYADQVRGAMRTSAVAVPEHLDHVDTARYIAGGAVAMLTAWLREDDVADPERMIDRLLAPMPSWLVGD